MIQKLKKNSALLGLIATVAVALFTTGMTWIVYIDQRAYARMQTFLFDCGVDAMGTLVAAGLYYGCMRQKGDGTETFRTLNVFVSIGFAVSFMLYYTAGVPEWNGLAFTFVLLSKLIDLLMIYFFYQYMRRTLGFEGKLAEWVEKGIPVLLALECLVILSNIFHPTTFMIDAKGMYHATSTSVLEDIYLLVASVVTTILIIRSKRPHNQKVAGLTFIFLPLVNYVMLAGTFGNASQYGMILVSLIVMYCIIFNEKSNKLAATETELNMATRIQLGALPPFAPEFPDYPNVNLRASMNTAKEVGGDFYDYFPIDDHRICFLIADVSGKGTPAALFMMTAKTMIKDYAMTQDSTSEIFTSVNARLCEDNDEGMFATAWIGILDTRTMTLQYTNAGHNYPVLMRAGQPCEMIRNVHGLFLGGMEFTQYRQAEIQLEPGDRLLLYTDGVVEAHDRNDELDGDDRLKDLVDATRDLPGEQVLERVLHDVGDFATGVPQFDDITMVVLTIKATPHNTPAASSGKTAP